MKEGVIVKEQNVEWGTVTAAPIVTGQDYFALQRFSSEQEKTPQKPQKDKKHRFELQITWFPISMSCATPY